jgi:hypothetical protein
MQHQNYPSAARGTKDIGWLKSKFTFSFSSYQNPTRIGFGLLKTFNDDMIQPGGGFGLHPHTNMEIISVLLQGTMNHKDTLGYSEEVTTDWVQIMSAGTGLRHQEHNIGNNEVHLLQIWIEPKLQNINPRYQKRYFPKSKRTNTLTTIVSNEEGQAHCWINQNAKLALGYYNQAGSNILYTFNTTNKGIFLFVITGSLTANDVSLQQGDAIGIWDTNLVNITTTTPETEFILIETPINH